MRMMTCFLGSCTLILSGRYLLLNWLYTGHWNTREPRRDQERGGGAGLRKLDFFCFSCSSTAVLQTLSLWLCSAQQLKLQLRSTLVATQWRGPYCFNISLSLFWRRSTASSVFLFGTRGQAFTLFLHSSLSSSLISHLAAVDVKQNVYLHFRWREYRPLVPLLKRRCVPHGRFGTPCFLLRKTSPTSRPQGIRVNKSN